SWYSKIINPFVAKVYEGKAAFLLSRKRTQTNPTARIEKTFFTKRTQIFLVTKDHKPFCCKGLRRHGCMFAIKKTNPNEPKQTTSQTRHARAWANRLPVLPTER
ncbi:MAG: hypothetical protein ACYS29_06615, partial [Planctomycetota bacterium]